MSYNRRQFIQTGLVGAMLPLLPSAEAKEQPAIRYNFAWDRSDHVRLACRKLPRTQSCYFDMPPWTPRASNQEGPVSYYDTTLLLNLRKRLAGLDRKAYYRDILDHVLKEARTDQERVTAICGFVGDAIYFNPVYLPLEPPVNDGPGSDSTPVCIMDPVELLELHEGRCGQFVAVTLALFETAEIEGRKVQVTHHISCEAKYDGGWHLADALMFGAKQPHGGGVVFSGEEIRKNPYLLDSFPVPHLMCNLEELLSVDGFRCLGYAGGEWGSSLMPFASWYWGAPIDNPPTLPYPLVTQRLDGQRVRLNWSPSFKAGGGEIEYHIEIFADRDCKQPLQKAVSKVNYLEWEVPQKNTIYYFEVRAKDDHRRFNPDTWYPAARNNFLLVPPEHTGGTGLFRQVAIDLMSFTRRQFIQTSLLATTAPFLTSATPVGPRRNWMREGVVTASNMAALMFLERRGGESADIVNQWHADRSEASIRKLKELGVNLVIASLHCGFGLKAEKEDIEATRAYTQLAHRYGLKVAGYIGATMMYETFFKEEPQARYWRQVNEFGFPIYYTSQQTNRYMACRNNPGYMAFLKKVMRLGIRDLGLDVLHFDQVMWWPEPQSCRCRYCRRLFREFLARRYADPARARLRFGFADFSQVIPPPYNLTEPPVLLPELVNPLMQEWSLFRAASVARQWRELAGYTHSLSPEATLIGNPTMSPQENVGFMFGVDLGQLLQSGDGVWSEDDSPNTPQWTDDGRLVSQIRSYKSARAMGQTLFTWQNLTGYKPLQESPEVLRLAEALAFNDANLGVLAGGDAGGDDPPEVVRRYIRFFWSHIADLRHTTPVADVGMVRSFASTQFNPSQGLFNAVLFEQVLIQCRVPFGLVFDQQMRDLSRYKVLVLADQDALSDEQVTQIRRFVTGGGGLVVTGNTGELTDWRTRRSQPALADLYGNGRVIYLPRIEAAAPTPPAQMTYIIPNDLWKLPHNAEALAAAVRQAAGGGLSLEAQAPPWVVAELADQPATGTRLLHLINFKYQEPLRDLAVRVRLPDGARFREAALVTPDGPSQVLNVAMDGDTASFRVPELKVYNLVLLRTSR